MAYVKVGSHTNAGACLTYGTRKKGKIREGVIASGLNCDPSTADYEFKFIANLHKKTAGKQVYTITQSFAPADKISMEQANKIGIEMAQRIFGERHQAVVYTHNDGIGGKIHNHIMINATNMVTGRKFDTHGFLYRARRVSNDICREHGLSVIDKNYNRKAPSAYPTRADGEMKSRGKVLWKEELRQILNAAKKKCGNIDDFKNCLKKQGITINERKTSKEEGGIAWTYNIDFAFVRGWRVRQNDGHKPVKIRGRTLGEEYTRAGVIDFYRQQNQQKSNDIDPLKFAIINLKNGKDIVDAVKSTGFKFDLSAPEQAKLLNNLLKIKTAGARLNVYAKHNDLDDWNLLSEAEKSDKIAHQAMDRW